MTTPSNTIQYNIIQITYKIYYLHMAVRFGLLRVEEDMSIEKKNTSTSL